MSQLFFLDLVGTSVLKWVTGFSGVRYGKVKDGTFAQVRVDLV